MKKINRNNYEQYFIEYIDGTLDPELDREIQDFLPANPDLEAELEMIKKDTSIEAENIDFRGKEKMKIPDLSAIGAIGQSNYLGHFIGYIEKDLETKDRKAVEDYLRDNPRYKKDFQYLKAAKLKTFENVRFESKEKLYKELDNRYEYRKIIYFISSIAAILLLFFVFRILFVGGPNEGAVTPTIADNTKEHQPVSKDIDPKVQIPEQNESIKAIKHKTFLMKKADVNNISSNQEPLKDRNIRKKIQISEMTALACTEIAGSTKEYAIHHAGLDLSQNHILENVSGNPATESHDGNEGRNKSFLQKIYDNNNDQKLNYWEVVTLATNTINKFTGDTLVSVQFSDRGELTYLALANDLLKITKSKKN